MFDRKPVFSSAVLTLKTQTPVAEGGRRLCFRHPDNPNFCLKISKPDVAGRIRSREPFYKRWRPLYMYDDNLAEAKAYRQWAIRKGTARIWDHLPRLYGWQDTDIGLGLVMDYYATDDKPAKTLEAILRTEGLTPDIKSALHVFGTYLRETRLMTRALLPHNIVLAADGKLKLIDGLGERTLFLYGHIRYLARRKVERRLADMHLRVARKVR